MDKRTYYTEKEGGVKESPYKTGNYGKADVELTTVLRPIHKISNGKHGRTRKKNQKSIVKKETKGSFYILCKILGIFHHIYSVMNNTQ